MLMYRLTENGPEQVRYRIFSTSRTVLPDKVNNFVVLPVSDPKLNRGTLEKSNWVDDLQMTESIALTPEPATPRRCLVTLAFERWARRTEEAAAIRRGSLDKNTHDLEVVQEAVEEDEDVKKDRGRCSVAETVSTQASDDEDVM
ncbi:unnamed protein product [Amoebophrya sp. A120]|nr:unnamed protein product [Amoebophrya sp. A120]|eukprot:GSA120T00021962001.1